MTDIGSKLPKGVVDVAGNFVGVRPQGMNIDHEYARLKKQVALLRNRIEGMGMTDEAPQPGILFSLLGVAVACAGMAAVSLLVRRS